MANNAQSTTMIHVVNTVLSVLQEFSSPFASSIAICQKFSHVWYH